MPIVWTTHPPRPSGAVLLWMAAVMLLMIVSALIGWLQGADHAIAKAEQRAQRVAVAHDEAVLAERARTEAAYALAAEGNQRCASALRQLRLARAELREMRASLAPLDLATGVPLAPTADCAAPTP